MQNFKRFVSLLLGRFRGFLFLFLIFFSSCNDLHKKIYNTFHGDKDSTRHSVVAYDLLSPEEEKDSIAPGTTPTPWENAGIKDVRGVKLFIKKLKYWLEENNKDSIASYIKYPLMNDEKISSPKIFLEQYDKIFNAKVKQALKDQKLNDLFRNFQGVMIGTGEIWVANVSENDKEVYKIISINYDE